MKEQKRERQLASRTRPVARVWATGALPGEEGNDGGDSESQERRGELELGVRTRGASE
jgi:hypothetical protein